MDFSDVVKWLKTESTRSEKLQLQILLRQLINQSGTNDPEWLRYVRTQLIEETKVYQMSRRDSASELLAALNSGPLVFMASARKGRWLSLIYKDHELIRWVSRKEGSYTFCQTSVENVLKSIMNGNFGSGGSHLVSSRPADFFTRETRYIKKQGTGTIELDEVLNMLLGPNE